MYGPGCALIYNQFYLVNGAIYLIANYDKFTNTLSC